MREDGERKTEAFGGRRGYFSSQYKKFKDCHRSHETNENGTGSKMGSYKEKLVGAIPGAFAQAFGFDSSMQEDLESDNEEVNDPMAVLELVLPKKRRLV